MFTQACIQEAEEYLKEVSTRLPQYETSVPFTTIITIKKPNSKPFIENKAFYWLNDQSGVPIFRVLAYEFVEPQTFTYLESKGFIEVNKDFKPAPTDQLLSLENEILTISPINTIAEEPIEGYTALVINNIEKILNEKGLSVDVALNITAHYKNLVLTEEGNLIYNNQALGRISPTNNWYAFIKSLMDRQKDKEEWISKADIIYDTKISSNLEDLYTKINQKHLQDTPFKISSNNHGAAYMLTTKTEL